MTPEGSPAPEPNSSTDALRGHSIRESIHTTSVSIVGLFILALIGALYIAKPILLPMMLALVLTFVLRPIHGFLERLFLPPVVAAVVILAVLLLVSMSALVYLAPALTAYVEEMPRNIRAMEDRLADIQESVSVIARIREEWDDLARLGREQPVGEVLIEVTERRRVGDAVLSRVTSAAGYLFFSFVLLFFFLAFGGRFYRHLAKHSDIADMITDVGRHVSSYLLTVTLINSGLGVAIGIVMYLLGMPNPALWGVMGGLFNFIPYLGAMAGCVIVGLVALLTFDSLIYVAIVPAAYFALTSTEGNFVTPMILGRQFTTNPVIIFVWLLFWGWLWGVPGAIVAVPSLMAFRIVCTHFKPLRDINELMEM